MLSFISDFTQKSIHCNFRPKDYTNFIQLKLYRNITLYIISKVLGSEKVRGYNSTKFTYGPCFQLNISLPKGTSMKTENKENNTPFNL